MRIAPKPQQGQEITLDKLLNKNPPKPKPIPGIMPQSNQTMIQDFGTYWRLSPIRLREGLYTYDLLNGLLDGGEEKDFEGWMGYSLKSNENGDFIAAASDTIFAIIDFLHKHLKDPKYGPVAKEAWDYIGKSFHLGTVSEPILLTRCVYNPNPELDEVFHDSDLPTQYSTKGRLRGLHGIFYGHAQRDEFARLILGCSNGLYASQVLKELLGNDDPFIARLLDPPECTEEYSFQILASAYPWPLLQAKSSFNVQGPAFGVAARQLWGGRP